MPNESESMPRNFASCKSLLYFPEGAYELWPASGFLRLVTEKLRVPWYTDTKRHTPKVMIKVTRRMKEYRMKIADLSNVCKNVSEF